MIEIGIMLEILERVTKTDKPALGIHDSVLCRQRDEDEEVVKREMANVYRERTGHQVEVIAKPVHSPSRFFNSA